VAVSVSGPKELGNSRQVQRQFAVELVERLTAAGFQAVLAGGCVRDELLGRVPDDYDIATSATPEQVQELFGRQRTLAIGAAFGVIAVLGPRGCKPVEIATFRRDETYSDGRHPDAVQFSSDRDDALRRDFTINGLFYDPLQDKILDYVGGADDLARRLVRAIGDPIARFREDHLRMLRAIRFTVRLDFQLDPATLQAIRLLAARIVDVSAERIAQELRLMWSHRPASAATQWLHTSGLLAHVWPELGLAANLAGDAAPFTPSVPPWTAALDVLQRLERPQLPLVVAVLAHHALPTGPEAWREQAERIGRRWRLARDEVEQIDWLGRHQGLILQAHQQPWPRVQRVLIDSRIQPLLDWCRAELLTTGRPMDAVQFCEERLKWPEQDLNPPPLVTGQDLLDYSIPRGPWYKRMLDQLRDEQLMGQLTNKSAARERMAELWQVERSASGNPPDEPAGPAST
jgi:poly(A) polymerase